MTVCDSDLCTGCGACINICPKKCIHLKRNAFSVEIAEIDDDVCIQCGNCKRVCPSLNSIAGAIPGTCYAAWSLDNKTRWGSASGGVASELYKLECAEGGNIAGVTIFGDGGAVFTLSNNQDEVEKFRNSKYVFSDTRDVYSQIADVLSFGESVTFIGTPCQVAGLKSFLLMKKVNTEKLFTADLVCHGFAPAQYLQEHIKQLEKRHNRVSEEVSFRDPEFQTHSYMFSLKEAGKVFYKKRVHRTDTYQVGYHSGIAYRENCYKCRYAMPERQGDVTLADFSWVGSATPCNYDNKNVSCVLVNTEKGANRIRSMAENGKLFIEKRPMGEAMGKERQLKSPTAKPKERAEFLRNYLHGEGFDKALFKAAKSKILKNEFLHYLHIDFFKRLLHKLVPTGAKRMLKRLIRGNR